MTDVFSQALAPVIEEYPGNQEAAENEEEIHSNPGHRQLHRVVEEHEQERDGAQAVELRDPARR